MAGLAGATHQLEFTLNRSQRKMNFMHFQFATSIGRCLPAAFLAFGATGLTLAAAPELAFPGAVGWAAHTPGGRGGKIVRVTTLAASGPGSFAEAVATPGPRIVVFEVGGVIDLNTQTIRIKEPFLTIAGQTAPSPGITFIRGGLLLDTHDVVMQHICVRPGTAGQPRKGGWEPDGLSTLQGARNIIVDHCSFTWAIDENLSVSGKFFAGKTPDEWRRNASQRVTFSHNIIAEGLSHATHSKDEHSKGTLLMDNSSEILIYANLYADNVNRNPEIKGGTFAAVINNFIYNPRGTAVNYHMTDVWKGHEIVVVKNEVAGNVLRHGPDTPAELALFRFGGLGDLEFHQADNLAFDRTGKPARLVYEDRRYGGKLRPSATPVYRPPDLMAMPATQVEEYVSRNAGAHPWDRDPIDERIIRQSRDGSGRVINSEEEVGGYPAQKETHAHFDPAEWDLRTMTRRGGPSHHTAK
jgi:pectate lyase